MSTTSVSVLSYQTTFFKTFYFGNTNKMSRKLLSSSDITEQSLRYIYIYKIVYCGELVLWITNFVFYLRLYYSFHPKQVQ